MPQTKRSDHPIEKNKITQCSQGGRIREEFTVLDQGKTVKGGKKNTQQRKHSLREGLGIKWHKKLHTNQRDTADLYGGCEHTQLRTLADNSNSISTSFGVRCDQAAAAKATGDKATKRAWCKYSLEPCERQGTCQTRGKKVGTFLSPRPPSTSIL